MNPTMPGGFMNRSLSLVVQCILAFAILIILYFISLQNYLLFHGIVEIAGIAIAFSIFILVWNTRRVITNTFFLIVGISFLFTGSIDLLHTLAYKGMGVFAGNSSDLPTQLWIAARYFQSITFFIAALFIGKSITKDRNYDTGIILAACAAFFSLLLASIFVWHNFPPCFVEAIGLTPFKIFSEYLITLILIATIVILFIKRRSFETGVWQLLVAAQIFLILGELAFTSYISVYGFMNMLGHLFRLISVYLFYQAFVVVGLSRPYELLLRELKQEEDALRETELRFRTMADWTSDWEYWVDLDRNFIYLSPSVEQITGYRPEEFMADPALIDRLVYPDDRRVWDEHVPLHKSTQDTGASEIEFRLVHKDGSVRRISHICRSIFLEDGTCIGRRISNRDITERKENEEALRHKTAILEAQLNSSIDGILIVDPEGKKILQNQRCIELWKIPANVVNDPDDQTQVNQVMYMTKNPEQFVEKIVYLYSHPEESSRDEVELNDGTILDRYSAPVLGEDGHNYGRIWTFRDITERKQAEDLLREEQQFSKSLIDSLPGIFYLYSYPDHKLKRWNKLHETIFGYTAEEMNDRLATDWHLPEFRDAVLKATEEVMEKGQSTVESSLLAKDGHPVPLLLTGVRFEAGGQLYYMGIGIDITERKKTEALLKRFTEELEEKVRERTNQLQVMNLDLEKEVGEHARAEEQIRASLDEKIILLREIHHRVKNNLQIIISLLNLQSRYIKDEKTRQALRESQNRVRAMSHVHEKLYQSPDITKIELDSYIRFLGDSLFQFYGMRGKGIILTTRIQDIHIGLETAIPIGLIVNELISNSLKHAFPEGRGGVISITIQRQDGMLAIGYSDNGVGMPEGFDWRNAGSLGLRLVILLVEQMDGTIERDPRAGTAFTIIVKEKE